MSLSPTFIAFTTLVPRLATCPHFPAAQIHTELAHGHIPVRSCAKALTTNTNTQHTTKIDQHRMREAAHSQPTTDCAQIEATNVNDGSTKTTLSATADPLQHRCCAAHNAKQTAHNSRIVPHACNQNAVQHQE